MKNNRRKANNRVKQPETISALIEKQNIWSEWSAGCWIGPLSWVQMAALLMRDTRPEIIINRLAPLLDRTRQEVEGNYRKWAKGAPADPKFLTTYENYREHFQDELLEQFRGFLKTLEGNSDLEWLRDRLIASQAGAQSFVWFLLNGIAIAQIEGELDESCIKHDARWLAELDFYEPAYLAGDEAVLREFYETFRESFARAAPLPDKPSTSRWLHTKCFHKNALRSTYGYDVQSYTSGQALLADPCAAAADCLVIDYSMPDVDGVTVLQGLRARGWRGRAILVSAYCDCALAAKARASGFDDVIAKPFIARAVREAIGSYLRPGR